MALILSLSKEIQSTYLPVSERVGQPTRRVRLTWFVKRKFLHGILTASDDRSAAAGDGHRRQFNGAAGIAGIKRLETALETPSQYY